MFGYAWWAFYANFYGHCCYALYPGRWLTWSVCKDVVVLKITINTLEVRSWSIIKGITATIPAKGLFANQLALWDASAFSVLHAGLSNCIEPYGGHLSVPFIIGVRTINQVLNLRSFTTIHVSKDYSPLLARLHLNQFAKLVIDSRHSRVNLLVCVDEES